MGETTKPLADFEGDLERLRAVLFGTEMRMAARIAELEAALRELHEAAEKVKAEADVSIADQSRSS